MREYIYRVLIFLISLVISLALAELLLAKLELPPAQDILSETFWHHNAFATVMPPDATAKFLKPNSLEYIKYHSNRFGYRDAEWEQKTGAVNVLLLGDSFGWGWGCSQERTMAAILDASNRYRVCNVSAPGSNLVHYDRTFHAFNERIRPDVVVMLTYLNDFFEPEKLRVRFESAIRDTHPQSLSLETVPFPETKNPQTPPLLTRFRLYRFFQYLRQTHFQDKTFWMEGFRDDLEFLSDESQIDKALRLYGEILDRLQGTHRIVVVYIPPIFEISGKTKNILAQFYDVSRMRHRFFYERLAQIATSKHAAFLNLEAIFGQEQDKEALYYAYDNHLTEKGQTVAGYALKKFLIAVGC